ncbi:unnamed protein product [Symbiodinium sp. CCMP2592]|nr:unnamed protein product [Symbiodinium sp. CCMP2592]
MRFHRSLVSPNTPPEILKLAEKAEPHSPERSYLFEAWLTSSENWKSSKLLISLKQKNSTKNRGTRKWMTYAEMCERFGESVATDIRDAKLDDPQLKKKEVRDHPECKHRKARTPYTTELIEPTTIEVPVRSMDTEGNENIVPMQLPVLDVHEVLAYLHNEVKVEVPAEMVQNYYAHMEAVDMPWIRGFPGDKTEIPFSLYGDECCLSADPHDKVVAFFMSIHLFRPTSVRQGQFLIAAVQHDLLVDDECLRSLFPILQHIVWSCNVAFEGRYPHTRFDGGSLTPSKLQKAGTPLANGRRWVCSQVKGDWKWLEKVLRLLPTPVSKQPCYMCDACSDDSAMKYYDTGDIQQEPGWAATEVNTVGFIARKVRMTLVSLGYFGDPDALDLQQLLDAAFADFKAWKLQHRIPCSQKRFSVGLVIKKVHGHYMTAKAYNGRVILEWLADVTTKVLSDKKITDPRLPHLAVALKLGMQYLLISS